MQALTNLELTERLLSLEQSLLQNNNRSVANTERSETALNSCSDISPKTAKNTADIDFIAMECDIDLESEG